MALARTHRPIWNPKLCLSCLSCTRRCPVSTFPEQAEEKDSLRGRVARQLSFSSKLPGLPPCQSACPLGQDVPGYVVALAEGDFDRALRIVIETNPFPAVLGRLCHHPCMRACVRNALDEPVPIRALKRAAAEQADRAPEVSLEQKEPGEKVAVVGAGPAGLSAAFFLQRLGREVTVYEAEERSGGLLRYAVPSFDLPRKVLEADLRTILASGVKIKTSTPIRSKQEVAQLFGQGARAVILALGSGRGRLLGIAGEDLEGCQEAVSFARAHREGSGPRLSGPAVVAGSGAMAAAAARLALRSGAKPVTLLLGRVQRTKSTEPDGIRLAEQEGVQVVLGLRATLIAGKKRVAAVHCVPLDSSGQEAELRASLFVAAEDRVADLWWLEGIEDLALTAQGTLQVDRKSFMASPRGVFGAGEAVTGPRNLVRAVATGLQAAKAVDRFLRGEQSER